ncbi:major facilitator superfamily domain-containing protein 9-like [Euwallacea fornicatus]|uniref:major facilitator superfamily domain-containing protein 9-like n=1 Tax=Euwallacea fornicatus TaxID=995702 RepID=UPI00338E6479
MRLLYILFFLDMLNLAVFLPVFNPFIKSIGGTPFIIGILNSSSALVSLLWNPIVGSLSDQLGRKGLLVKCLWASAIGSLLMAFSNSLIVVFLGKLIGSLGSGVGILLRSIVADIYRTAEEKNTFFNKCASFMSVGFLLGSVSSGFISELENGFSMAFLLMAAIMGVASLISMRTLPDDSATPNQITSETSILNKGVTELKSAAANLKTIAWDRYKSIFYIKGFYDFSISIIFTNIGLILINEFDVKGRTIGYVFMMVSLFRIAANILKLKFKNILVKIRVKNQIIGGGIVLFISYIAMALSESIIVFMPFLAIMVFARAFLDTILTEVITTKTTQTDRGKVIGAYENLYSFNMFVAPLFSGILSQIFGQRFVLGSAAIPIAISIAVANGETESEKTE